MTIEQLAIEIGVTRQAICNRISRAGISMQDISAGKVGKQWVLTEQGADKIRKMMRKTSAKTQQKKDTESQQQIAMLSEQLKRQRKRADQLAQLFKEAQHMMQKQADLMANQAQTLQRHAKTIDTMNKSLQAQALTLAAQTRIIEQLQEKQRLIQPAKVVDAEEPQKDEPKPAQEEKSSPEPVTEAGTDEEPKPATTQETEKPGMWARVAAWIRGGKVK